MKIAVVGAGAMGSLFGGHLAEAGNKVHLVDVNAEHAAALDKNGLSIGSNRDIRVIPVHAAQDPSSLGVMDLVIIQVKTYATRAAAESPLPMIGPETIVVTMQNGIGNVEIVAEVVGEQKVIGGVIRHGAACLSPGKIRHAVDAAIVQGELGGDSILKESAY
jgi:2-dehydropantoate 2-reductase